MPFTLKFFMGFESSALTPMIEATQYFGFAFTMMLAFGVAFELPIAILLLSALGLIKPQFLSKYRRHAIVVTVVVAAFITPDASPTTLFALSVPLYLLYELGVFLSYSVTRRRRLRAEAAEREEKLRAQSAAAAEPIRREPRRLGANA
jgi:sec-independent protein translocase protein TatC